MFSEGLLKGRCILITGGGSGLGAEMASRFATLGASIVICGRRQEPLHETARRIAAQTGASVQALGCDIRDPDAVRSMFDEAWRRGPVDTLVNNAAATFVEQTERLSARAMDAVLATTLHCSVYCTLEAGRRWIDEHVQGSVLSILSTSVRTGRAFTVPSAIAKSGLQAMTRSLAVEWGGKGIRLLAIAPGLFPTDGTREQLLQGNGKRSDPAGLNPLQRVGQPIELANLATYLLSAQAGYINGETVAIDGGAHLRTSGAEDLLAWTEQQWEEHRAHSRSRRASPVPRTSLDQSPSS